MKALDRSFFLYLISSFRTKRRKMGKSQRASKKKEETKKKSSEMAFYLTLEM